jgi:glutamate synthase domain-containing protein 2
MRACNSNNCPVGIATQKQHLRDRLIVDESSRRLHNFLRATTELMTELARACGHDHLSKFDSNDLVTFDREVAALTGVRYAGVVAP